MSSSVIGVSLRPSRRSRHRHLLGRGPRPHRDIDIDIDNAAIDADPAIPGSRIGVHEVPQGKSVKNRLHVDLITTELDAEMQRLTALGARTLNEVRAGGNWATLADPEGNEFDVIAG